VARLVHITITRLTRNTIERTVIAILCNLVYNISSGPRGGVAA